jgi:16S rRNA (uracil1498-N3)-methyltransferase
LNNWRKRGTHMPMSSPRLLVDAPLREGARISFDPDRSRYLGAVLRLGPGARVRVFNGADGEWLVRIIRLDKRGGEAEVEIQTRLFLPSPRVRLVFAPVKRHATDLIVEKATELGAARLSPVMTRRTVADTVRVDRLSLIAREAAEQSERLDAPLIDAPVELSTVVEGWSATAPLLYADEAGDPGVPALAVLANLPAGVEELALLIGPEGGFDPEERRRLHAAPGVLPVCLGPRILRAETAAIVLLALVQASWTGGGPLTRETPSRGS